MVVWYFVVFPLIARLSVRVDWLVLLVVMVICCGTCWFGCLLLVALLWVWISVAFA